MLDDEQQQVHQVDEASKAMSASVPTEGGGISNEVTITAPETPIDQPMQVQEGSGRQMSREEMLEENDFHDTVNDDTDMYDAIDGIPMDSENMADQVLGAVQNHVSEVWSPPRVTRLAEQFGLKAGFAYDLMTNDETGAPWILTKENSETNV